MEMGSLEDLVKKMESQMDRADSKLDFLSLRLNQFETKVLLPGSIEEISSDGQNIVTNGEDKTEVKQLKEENTRESEDDSGLDPKLVTELLFEVKRVKKEYDQLLQDLHQVQELQHEVTRSLRNQMKQVQSHFDRLRDRVVGSTGSGSVPPSK